MAYLEKEWPHSVLEVFLKKIDYRLAQLSEQPFTGILSENVKDVRAILITKHNRLYYKVKGKKVIVLNMFDTRMKPSRNRYK